jgi:hypothetical protein
MRLGASGTVQGRTRRGSWLRLGRKAAGAISFLADSVLLFGHLGIATALGAKLAGHIHPGAGALYNQLTLHSPYPRQEFPIQKIWSLIRSDRRSP